MADGSIKEVQHIQKGDEISSGTEDAARVECVVKTYQEGGVAEFVEFPSGLVITPWHPVMWQGKWTFPVVCIPA